ncbi:hypothetical protein CAEBREN_29424 [Caenorhabditis brenneri]|uniref:ABC transporter domain-containing protein n=1 Tax=Caenorhabditis brenneri TaxID=135651 RepID=G0NH61_CAEBE|nr:hypothetical protein CAEBREN_29424 [Caenorhabditis brenneri]
MVFKKLLHLLLKDVLLVRRSKVWTVFEVLLPLLLIATPPILIAVLTKGAGQPDRTPVMQQSRAVDLSYLRIDYNCDTPSYSSTSNVENYFDDAPLTWDDQAGPILGPKQNREDFIRVVRNCGRIVYIMETNMTSTIVQPLLGKSYKKYEFLGYNYNMNKILFGLLERYQQKSIEDLFSMTLGTYPRPVSNFDFELHTLPDVSVMSIGPLLFQLFPVFFGICLTMPIISATRNVLVEKDTVKPYLSTIGLPIWLFYLEHFVFGVIKSSILITLTSILWAVLVPGFPGFVLLGIFFYVFNSISFAIFFSTIFPSAKRVVEGMVLIWIATVLLSIVYTPYGAMNWIISLLPTSAFKNYIGAVILAADENGISFGSLFKTKTINSQCAAVYLAFMIFNTIWMLVAAIFMEKLFSFLAHVLFKKIWGILGNKKDKMSKIKTQSLGNQSTILNVQEKLNGRATAAADIELRELVKIYPNGEKAVNGLSLRAVRGQVSILLGHNGCGKSTTFGMITGMHKPTEGKVMIGGVDAIGKRAEARKLIGYCPQYNPLYDKLTVMEHLRLVNALKGGNGKDFKTEAESLLQQIELTDKKDTLAKKLSGGMKRKLCVCMAMIGQSRVILLDEPTAGMDPAARIDVQKMLTLVKADRTILLTTHYMDEAEKLGDWVFVMSHGEMAASGSIHYLKQKYGGGMLLTLVFKTSSDPKDSYDAALAVCKAICPSAVAKDERGQMMEIAISESEKSRLPALFRALEAILEHNFTSPDVQILGATLTQAQKLDLVTIGVSMSSLEQVFIKIGDECDAVINKTEGIDRKTERRKKFKGLIETKKLPPKQGFSRAWATVTALLQKRFYYLYRNPTQILLQIILPLAILWAFARQFAPLYSDSTLKQMMQIESLDLSEYPQSTILVQQEDKSDSRLIDYLRKYPNLQIMEVDYDIGIEEAVKKYSLGFLKLGFVIKVDQMKRNVKIYYDSTHEEHSRCAAILINLLASCMYLRSDLWKELPHISSNVYWMMDAERASSLRIRTNASSTASIKQPIYYRNVLPYCSELNPSLFQATIMEYIFILVALTLVIAGIVVQSTVYLIEERICKFSHQQYLTGLSTVTYWAVVFLWDFLLFTFFVFYVMIFVFAYGVFSGHEHEIIILYYCFLLYIAPLVYLASSVINSPTKGSFLVYIFFIISYFGYAITFLVLSGYSEKTKQDTANVSWIFRFLSPSVGFFMGVIKIAGVVYEHSGLKKGFNDLSNVWEFEGILAEILFLLLSAFCLTMILCCTTMKSTRRACFSMTHRKSKPKERIHYKGIESCVAVKEEEALIPKVDKDDKVLVVDISTVSLTPIPSTPLNFFQGLIKDFGKFRAVNSLSVSVGREECFGMLGANGAGKTTTFDIITGLTLPTGGDVTIEGKNITKTIHIGYCPQFDAMLQQISCRQTLKIMAKLQGYQNVKELVEIVLDCVGMTEHGNKLVKNCSGGQKRKISVGIALISRANCIILDEPTAGIDPRARREIWDIIHEMREQAKCSIILTSHSMEECEALCTRIGILRKGEMIALGTSQSLKSQYGNTYMMTMILYHLKDRDAVVKKVEELMSDAVLKTPESSLTTSIVWEIPKKKSDKWSQKYHEVENLAKRVNAKDYMLTQASLEDTFIRLITTE